MEPVIVTTFYPDGSMKKEAQGFGGQSCKVATEPYLRNQGAFVSEDTLESLEPCLFEENIITRTRG